MVADGRDIDNFLSIGVPQAPSAPILTLCSASSRSQNFAAFATPNTTMLVSTVSGSIVMPGSSASPAASSRALAWSSASRST